MPTNVQDAIKAQAAASKAIAKGVQRDLKLSDAKVDSRLRETRQSKMLEALFEVSIRLRGLAGQVMGLPWSHKLASDVSSSSNI